MIAKNIVVEPNTIFFDIINDDGTPYTNADGTPVKQSIGGWLNHMDDDYTDEDIEEYIENQLHETVENIKKEKARKEKQINKQNRLTTVKPDIDEEIKMIEAPVITFITKPGAYTSPLMIEVDVTDVNEIKYEILDIDRVAVTDGKIEQPEKSFSFEVELDPGNYAILIKAANKRDSTTNTLNGITIKKQGIPKDL